MKKRLRKFIVSVIAEAINQAKQDKKNYDIFPKYARQRSIEESYLKLKPFMQHSLIFNKKEALWDYVLQHLPQNGLLLELGVFRGVSINYFARALPKREFFGFDSFVGLSEDWSGLGAPKGSAFNLMGEKIHTEPNVELINGWIEDTFEPFLENRQEKISFLHIDTDTYKPARVALNASRDFLLNNALILFDDFHSYPNFEMHEFRAFNEFVAENKDIEMLPVAIGPEQMLFRVKFK